ncbi:hypothetical protein V6N13_096259 [Hibiscus sabdariffa]|uniref:Uncharacterized protein n=1 Tax=Hibiscus sabdariffa TaxID=183260 RepID=A0ABR2DG80_9ROSI
MGIKTGFVMLGKLGLDVVRFQPFSHKDQPIYYGIQVPAMVKTLLGELSGYNMPKSRGIRTAPASQGTTIR